jgi:phage shock protein PspC (stress-responsive transcriptional regulator)
MPKLSVSRSASNKWIFGVCAGLAQQFGVNPMWVRLGALGLAILPAGLGIIPIGALYLILAAIMPKDNSVPFRPA